MDADDIGGATVDDEEDEFEAWLIGTTWANKLPRRHLFDTIHVHQEFNLVL
jgi:hypothetical protein